jgi:hypothetical protein
MPTSNSNTLSRIFDSLPERVQSAIVAYANEVELSIAAVITFAIANFLELESVPIDDRQSHTEGNSILDDLPASLQSEIKNYAAEDEIPPEIVVELAITHFLDPDSVTFDDCLAELQHDQVELLRQQKGDRQATAA